MRRTLVAVMAMAVITPVALVACGKDGGKQGSSAWVATPSAGADPSAGAGSGTGTGTDKETESATVPVSLALTPATGKTGVPLSTEIGLKLAGGKVTQVTLKDGKGAVVPGKLRDDGTAWVPAKTLSPKQKYSATVVVTADDGQTTTQTTSFTTMGKPGKKTGTGLYLFDDRTYGVAMPVVVEFSPGIKKADRAAVQRRMFVSTSPAQPGVWSWTPNGTQAYYRGPEFWKPGTTLAVRIAVGGLPTGGGRYGDRDRSATAKIGRSFEMKVDNASKKMTVMQDGKTIKTMPVSLGKKSTPSVSGVMVVMEKKEQTVFDTTDTDGADGYVTDIEFAQRITWSGQYVHSAPWSVGAQGRRNVSHGCVNVSPGNARWLFERTLIGDPITVKGTEEKLGYGDGWTPWDKPWSEFVKGSALPVPASLK